MPKRVGHLYEKMCDKDQIRLAIKNGSKKKKHRRDVRRVLKNPEKYVDKVYDLLTTGSYTPTPPKVKHIHDKSCGKDRDITIVPFYPDGIIHQLIVMAMQDIIMRGMYRWSCASIPGRGNACARKYVRRALDREPRKTRYCGKMDIRHYYPSMDITGLMERLRHKIKDERFLALVERVVRSNPLPGAGHRLLSQPMAGELQPGAGGHLYTDPARGQFLCAQHGRHGADGAEQEEAAPGGEGRGRAAPAAAGRPSEGRLAGFPGGLAGRELRGLSVFPHPHPAAREVVSAVYPAMPEGGPDAGRRTAAQLPCGSGDPVQGRKPQARGLRAGKAAILRRIRPAQD